MLKGRLGLETARIPHADRHGCLWLQRGNLYVKDGTLRFVTSGGGDLQSGDYALPFQAISNILLGPGSTVSHDCLRLLARHGTGLVAIGEDGVPGYAVIGWYGLLATAGTPAPVINRLHAQIVRILAQPELQAAYVSGGLDAVSSRSPAEFTALISSDRDKWAKVIKAANIRIE